mmetsp:Transcript_10024/g.15226  ORF Transcript_10024/g.15226 Transcript_10024/m.15226 type:complete len:84 (+) Transcript_10024:2465-2716(+)
MDVTKQKSFIGSVPTDNILEALDNEDEDEIEKKLDEINGEGIADDSQEESNPRDEMAEEDLFANDDEDYDDDDGMDNGIPTDP